MDRDLSKMPLEFGETEAGAEVPSTSEMPVARREPCQTSAGIGKPMLAYRCYFLDERDRIRSFVELQAPSDAVATALAKNHPKHARRPFELWRGRVMICRSDRQSKSERRQRDPHSAA